MQSVINICQIISNYVATRFWNCALNQGQDKAPYLQVWEAPFSPLLVHRFSSLYGLLAILKSTSHFSILDTKRKQFLRFINMHLLLADAGSGRQCKPINLWSHIPILMSHQTATTLDQCPPKTGLQIWPFCFYILSLENLKGWIMRWMNVDCIIN